IMMRRILDAYGVEDADRMIPDLQGALSDYQRQLQSLQTALLASPGSRIPPAFGGGPPPAAGPNPAAGMGGIPGQVAGPGYPLPGTPAAQYGRPGALPMPGGFGPTGQPGGPSPGTPFYSQAA